MTIDEMKEKLKNEIKQKRFNHSVNVMNTAIELAKLYGANTEKAAIAGLIHDCAKDKSNNELFDLCHKYKIELDNITRKQPELLHGPVGSKIAIEHFDINDEEILSAIYYHTTGCENMSLLEKIIYIADYIEPSRDFDGVEFLRELAFEDIDKSLIYSLEKTIKFVIDKNALIHTNTVNARNYLIYTSKET